MARRVGFIAGGSDAGVPEGEVGQVTQRTLAESRCRTALEKLRRVREEEYRVRLDDSERQAVEQGGRLMTRSGQRYRLSMRRGCLIYEPVGGSCTVGLMDGKASC